MQPPSGNLNATGQTGEGQEQSLSYTPTAAALMQQHHQLHLQNQLMQHQNPSLLPHQGSQQQDPMSQHANMQLQHQNNDSQQPMLMLQQQLQQQLPTSNSFDGIESSVVAPGFAASVRSGMLNPSPLHSPSLAVNTYPQGLGGFRGMDQPGTPERTSALRGFPLTVPDEGANPVLRQSQQLVYAANAMPSRHLQYLNPGILQPHNALQIQLGDALSPSVLQEQLLRQHALYVESPSQYPLGSTQAGALAPQLHQQQVSSRATMAQAQSLQPAGAPPMQRRGEKRSKKKSDRPKRALTAYNIFFKDERARILAELKEKAESDSVNDDHASTDDKQKYGKDNKEKKPGEKETTSKNTLRARREKPHNLIGFEAMATLVSTRWKNVNKEVLADCKRRAALDMERYQAERAAFMEKQKAKLQQTQQQLESSVPEEERERYFADIDSQESRKKQRM